MDYATKIASVEREVERHTRLIEAAAALRRAERAERVAADNAALFRQEAFYSELLARSHRREAAMFANGIAFGMGLVTLLWALGGAAGMSPVTLWYRLTYDSRRHSGSFSYNHLETGHAQASTPADSFDRGWDAAVWRKWHAYLDRNSRVVGALDRAGPATPLELEQALALLKQSKKGA